MFLESLRRAAGLAQLRRQAKELKGAARAGDAVALARLGRHAPDSPRVTLSAAQLVIARELGFASWARLKAGFEGQVPHGVERAGTLPGPNAPFRVLALIEPLLLPALLAEAHQVSDRWEQVCLAFGDGRSQHGPMVYVVTAVRDATMSSLKDVLADERERLWEHANIDEPTPPAAEVGAATLTVDGIETPAQYRSEGAAWAAQAQLDPEHVVTVIGRGVDARELRLGAVEDLQPFLAGRTIELERMRTDTPWTPPEQ